MIVIVDGYDQTRHEITTLEELYDILQRTEDSVGWGEGLMVGIKDDDPDKGAIVLHVADFTGNMGEDL